MPSSRASIRWSRPGTRRSCRTGSVCILHRVLPAPGQGDPRQDPTGTGAGGISAAEALRTAARDCGKTTPRRALMLVGRQQHYEWSSPSITHQAHSGVSPIIGNALGDRYDRLWYRSAGRDRAALSAYREAGIWRRRRVANAPPGGSASRHRLTTSPGRWRFAAAMWACVHPSSARFGRRRLQNRKILDA